MLSRGYSSQRTIARSELQPTVNSLMMVLHEIKSDGAKAVGVITDHGHRAGQHHFVIVILLSGLKSNGERTINAKNLLLRLKVRLKTIDMKYGFRNKKLNFKRKEKYLKTTNGKRNIKKLQLN